MSKWITHLPCDDDYYCHISPIDDERPHIIVAATCWCKPTLLYVDPDTNDILSFPIVIHHSADCREVVEEAEAILRNINNT